MVKRAFALILCMLFFSSVMALSGCGKKAPAAEPPTAVQTEKIQTGLQSAAFTYAGDVRGRYESQFAFQVSGRIQTRLVSNGDSVQAGQALMQLDPADLKTRLDSSQAALRAAEADYKLSELTYVRYKELARQEVVSKQEFDTVASQYQVSAERLKAAQADYTQAGLQYGYGTLTSDAAGVIADIKVEAGQVVGAGQPALTLVRTGEVEIQINVPEQRVDDIRKASKVSVGFWALPGQELAGAVREVSGLADSQTRTYMVRVSIPQMPQVRYGMSANVKVWIGDVSSRIVLPAASVYQKDNKPHLWIVENDSLRLQPVELGDFIGEGVVIRSGVKLGDMVVTAGVQKLQAGQKVKIWDGRKI